MQTVRIAIVGAGLSGLYAAWLLQRQGISDYVVIEARNGPGGRIAGFTAPDTASSEPTASAPAQCFDLGPTWFWPEYQRQLHALVNDLGLTVFEHYEAGLTVLERSLNEPPMRVRGYASEPRSMRLAGGMSALVRALHASVAPGSLLTGCAVRTMQAGSSYVQLDCTGPGEGITRLYAEHVLLALPPRLAEHALVFDPPLPPDLARQWRGTPTWMAPHAKYLAVYRTPFWREQGLSGAGRSACGPLGEIHDASLPNGSAALFGFFGVPAQVRRSVPNDVLRQHCRAQLVRLFGSQAAEPVVDVIKDWSQDIYTATSADLEADAHHAHAPDATAESGPWKGRLTGIASEWSPQFPGYVAGAIDAAELGVRAVLTDHADAKNAGKA
jgi:monoamine oxidase